MFADANNVYEALAAAYFEVLQQLQNEGNIELPTFGRREHYPTRNFFFKRNFLNFLEQVEREDEWRDFKKVSPSLEDQFLEKINLKKEFKAYVDKKWSDAIEGKTNKE
ncbi:hypothetical protein MUB24_20365 [Lederbergia sp. NSJ-179]|uniref:hypothetical protein n=1 Tax=Lederbergia sp. NSJ-179 TaxID=2931402 RepID=UPI001FD29DE9|nr:hypothetical protein [Lederbergia sp. NSJ-179]MCJ7843184.1 hypothetical protein [Lederbergia sp. NSJ-179]